MAWCVWLNKGINIPLFVCVSFSLSVYNLETIDALFGKIKIVHVLPSKSNVFVVSVCFRF